MSGAVSEDALYLLFAELEKGLEEPTRRPAAASVLTHFCSTSKLDYQEQVPSLLTVKLLSCWAIWLVQCCCLCMVLCGLQARLLVQ